MEAKRMDIWIRTFVQAFELDSVDTEGAAIHADQALVQFDQRFKVVDLT